MAKRQNIKTASVIPVSRNPKTNNVYILLGLNDLYDDQPKGTKRVWSDLGGKINDDESYQDAAAREFREETADVFPEPMYNPSWIVKNSMRVFNNNRVMYVLTIPWQPFVEEVLFESVIRHLKALNKTQAKKKYFEHKFPNILKSHMALDYKHAVPRVKPEWLEMKTIKWQPINMVFNLPLHKRTRSFLRRIESGSTASFVSLRSKLFGFKSKNSNKQNHNPKV